MNRIVLLILVFGLLVSFAACVGRASDPDENEAKETADTEKVTEDTSDKLLAWTTHSYDKIITNQDPKGELSTDYTVYLTRGETEGCTLAVRSPETMAGITLTLVSGENEFIGITEYVMNKTHEIGSKLYTDALIPYSGRKVSLKKNIILPFMVEFTTTKDTPAGEYKYVYDLVGKKDELLATFNITVHVWDIVLPEDKSFATSAGLNKSWMGMYSGDSSEEMYKLWFDTELEHNINNYDVPYGILDERANEYMSDPRITSFMVPIPKNADGSLNEALLLQYYNKIKSNPDWLEKAYFLPLDEPRTMEHLAQLKQWNETLKRLCPGIEMTAPFYTNIQTGSKTDQLEHMIEYMDFWCPKLCLWDDVKSYGEFLTYTPSKSFAERIAEQKESGDKLWAYVCNDPDDPYAQMFIDTEGVHQRLMFWQCYQRDVEGFLYWTTAYYGYDKDGNHVNPWESTNTGIKNGKGETIYGCGFLFYPGKDVGIKGCVPSIRAKIVRDGADDVELFYLAEEALGKDWLISKTLEGTPSLTEYADCDTFAALRIEIGNALEAALG